MTWIREVDVRGPAGPAGAFPADAARRSDPGYPQVGGENFVEVVDQRGQFTFLSARGTDGAPTPFAAELIGRSLREAGILVDDGSGAGQSGVAYPSGPVLALGDSMTEDDAWLASFATDTSLTIRDCGVAGQTTTEIAFRSGALQVGMTVTGNQIPASGSVLVTALNPGGDWRTGVTVQWTVKGSLAGVSGTFYHATATNGGAKFVRDKPGTAVDCPAGTVFQVAPDVKTGVGFERCPVTIWGGRNNPTSLAAIQRDIQAMTTRFPSPKRLILSVTNMRTEPAGSNGYNSVKAINEWLATTYPTDYVDVRRWLIDDALRVMGLTATSEDTAAIAEDRIPPQLMADDTHLTPATSAALGHFLAAEWRKRGI